MSGFNIGDVRPVAGAAPPPSAKSRALQLIKPAGALAVRVDSVRRVSGGALANTGARLATGFFTFGGAALSAGSLAAVGASTTSIAVAVTLFAANYVTKLVFSKPLVALGALVAGERPGEAVKQVFG